ncbi:MULTISPECIES: helix-turn-helix transcriptional regulator [unclassified Chelatococcus]|uniref:helix-turn-helix domain-containing protein n=1 Tax=unclassified Chelatococcus TaxID=2638111 RepID=UPI001BD0A94A|nr:MULTISPECIES: helix-turn-helix transcriptional regulator [unclassified Chelatococcus]MBS7696787.1 helix-turn-helix transcriptional regulator [Chelatococcus sp. YT9]MBX3558375.1 helix-turn-helix transcriptional regulator [Chelatococcus sp.]
MVGRIQLDEKTKKARQQGGVWLRRLREDAGLSQRDLAKLIDIDFYTFISQVEIGKGRIPPEKYLVWSKALKVDPHEFALNIIKYYNPFLYDLLFPTGARAKAGASAKSSLLDTHGLQEEIRELQRLLGEKTLEVARLQKRLEQSEADAQPPAEELPPQPGKGSRARGRKKV